MFACIGLLEPAVWQAPWAHDLSHTGVSVFLGLGWQVMQSPPWLVRISTVWQPSQAHLP